MYNEVLEKKIREKLGANAHYLDMHKPMRRQLILKRRNELNSKYFPSEKWFHKELKKRNCLKAVRNFPVGNMRFFGDFLVRQKKLVVEIDGKSHDSEEQKEYDRRRDAIIEASGYKVIRIKFGAKRELNAFFEKYGYVLAKPKDKIAETQKQVQRQAAKLLKEKHVHRQKLNRDIVSLRQKINGAIGYAKSIAPEKGNEFLAKKLKQWGLTPEYAKAILA